jgi:hypothetical protein
MGWFRKQQGPLDRQLRELDKQLRQLDAQVRQLQRSPAKALGKFQPASTTFPTSRGAPAGAMPPAAPEPELRLPRERDLWSRPAAEEQRVRSGERQPWWRLLFGAQAKPRDPRLVSYLSTGSFKTVRPLRYERRMARYRYAFSFAVLGGIILLLVFALQKCG